LYPKGYRGFESLSLRQTSLAVGELRPGKRAEDLRSLSRRSGEAAKADNKKDSPMKRRQRFR